MYPRTLHTIIALLCIWSTAIGQSETKPQAYILYWGQMEAKMHWNPEQKQYHANIEVKPSEFRLSVQREPRLWTGSTILKTLEFNIEAIHVACQADKKEVYFQSRASLDQLAVKADAGIHYALKMQMPDSNHAFVEIKFAAVKAATEDKEFWQKSGLLKESVWGKPLAQLTEKREFVSYIAFRKALEDWFAHLRLLPLTSDKEALISIVSPTGQAKEIKLPRSINKTDAQARIKKAITKEMLLPGSQVFFQIRPKDAWVGDFLLFYIVREDDPLLHRNKYDRRLFGFEWGHFRFELKGYYGNAIILQDGTKKAVDAEVEKKDNSLDKAGLKQLLDLELRVWERKVMLKNLEYTLIAGPIRHNFQAGGRIPPMVRSQIEAAIDRGEAIEVTGFKAENMDLSNLRLIFSPKQ